MNRHQGRALNTPPGDYIKLLEMQLAKCIDDRSSQAQLLNRLLCTWGRVVPLSLVEARIRQAINTAGTIGVRAAADLAGALNGVRQGNSEDAEL
jgi:hypothetical protein